MVRVCGVDLRVDRKIRISIGCLGGVEICWSKMGEVHGISMASLDIIY